MRKAKQQKTSYKNEIKIKIDSDIRTILALKAKQQKMRQIAISLWKAHKNIVEKRRMLAIEMLTYIKSSIQEKDLNQYLQIACSFRKAQVLKQQFDLYNQSLIDGIYDELLIPKTTPNLNSVYDACISQASIAKAEVSSYKKMLKSYESHLGGIADLIRLKNKKDLVGIIIGQIEDKNAIIECKKLGIKMFHIVDTDCYTSLADHVIPANNDSYYSVKYILTKIIKRISLAKQINIDLIKYK